jgi:hypothetical protein
MSTWLSGIIVSVIAGVLVWLLTDGVMRLVDKKPSPSLPPVVQPIPSYPPLPSNPPPFLGSRMSGPKEDIGREEIDAAGEQVRRNVIKSFKDFN